MDVLSFAIKMEQDGEAYYREQAEKNKGNGLFYICSRLADDERNHALLLRSVADSGELCVNDLELGDRNVFSDLADIVKDGDVVPEQLDFYRMAAERERESIELYTNMAKETNVKSHAGLFGFLIRQEKEHLSVLEEMISLLENAKDWVESPEFGNREEY